MSDIGFLKFKYPVIKEIVSVDTILTTDKLLEVGINGYALAKGMEEGYTCTATLSKEGKVISTKSIPLSEKFSVLLPLKNLSRGKHKLELGLYNANKELTTATAKDVKVVTGF